MWYFTGGCHQSYGCNKFQTFCSSCHFFKKKSFIDLANYGFKKKKKLYESINSKVNFICPSSQFENFAKSSKIAYNKNVYYIPNILDEDKYIPSDYLKKKNCAKKFNVLFGAMGGKTNRYKGWDYFVEAINLLSPKLRDNIEIILFGYDFTNKELEELSFQASSVGFINDDESMIELYQRAHVYVFPSLQESFGQTLFEAMSCGVPAVAYPVGAAKDLINHKYNGYLAEYKSAMDLASGIEFLLENEDLNLFSIRARNKIKNEFSSKIILDKHIKLITNSLK